MPVHLCVGCWEAHVGARVGLAHYIEPSSACVLPSAAAPEAISS